MSVLPDLNIWIPSRVPQSLACPDCGRPANFMGFQKPDRYQYSCDSCHSTKTLTLSQINSSEANRFHKLPHLAAAPIVSRIRSAAK